MDVQCVTSACQKIPALMVVYVQFHALLFVQMIKYGALEELMIMDVQYLTRACQKPLAMMEVNAQLHAL